MLDPRNLTPKELCHYAYLELKVDKGLPFLWSVELIHALENFIDKEQEASVKEPAALSQ